LIFLFPAASLAIRLNSISNETALRDKIQPSKALEFVFEIDPYEHLMSDPFLQQADFVKAVLILFY
jgi:hypothetical protein